MSLLNDIRPNTVGSPFMPSMKPFFIRRNLETLLQRHKNVPALQQLSLSVNLLAGTSLDR